MKAKQGFTLIELMIVVAIIAIIAAIAIPNLLRSRQTANEGAALGAMRTISSAEAAFQAASQIIDEGIGQYGELGDLYAPPAGGTPFIDQVLGEVGTKHGYDFVVTPTTGNPPEYDATGEPQGTGSEGMKFYFLDESGVIRFNIGSSADESSDVIQ